MKKPRISKYIEINPVSSVEDERGESQPVTAAHETLKPKRRKINENLVGKVINHYMQKSRVNHRHKLKMKEIEARGSKNAALKKQKAADEAQRRHNSERDYHTSQIAKYRHSAPNKVNWHTKKLNTMGYKVKPAGPKPAPPKPTRPRSINTYNFNESELRSRLLKHIQEKLKD